LLRFIRYYPVLYSNVGAKGHTMKKILLLLILSLALYANEASTFAQQLGYLNSYKTALSKAKKEHKLLMLVIVEDGCGFCERFKRTTLSLKEIQLKTASFVRVIIDKNEKIPLFFQTSFVPVVYFVDPNTLEPLVESIGYHSPARFLKKINEAKMQWAALK
jgi:hypothetical protein